YRRGHIPGAWWGLRSRLDEALLPDDARIVLYADDDRMAHLAATTLSGLEIEDDFAVLAGGLEAWRAAGKPVEADDGRMTLATTEPNDVWYKPYDTDEEVRAKMEEYLVWEVALVEQMARDGTVNFRTYP
ncbi:MAG: rhodanese-like domain-containing protein, partial [Rhodospirillaceae bacterium]|nr:rhodanese-like domain-containing protein [Rhodospirillaceae bacterium]